MKEKVLIVEDQFVEADYLRMMLTKAGYPVTGIAYSVVQAREMIAAEKPGFVLLDIFLKGSLTGIDLARELAEENIAFVYLSANSNEDILNAAKATQPYGFLVKPFREKDLLITLEIARYRHEHSIGRGNRNEHLLQQAITGILNSSGDSEQKLLAIAKSLQPHVPFDYLAAGFNTINENSPGALSFLRVGFDEYQAINLTTLVNLTGLQMTDLIVLKNNTSYEDTAGIFNENNFEMLCRQPTLNKLFLDKFKVKSTLSLPLYLSNGKKFIINFYSRQTATYHSDHLVLLNRMQHALSFGIENILSLWKSRLVAPKDYFLSQAPENITPAKEFDGIIGKSHLLLNVFDLISQVALSDTSVLILGESGTGKERIADCIHQLSTRRNESFIKVNCATLPPTLIESELFGHEKGAFTGAIEKRIGKFEKADKGTIFLDEIGEMPPELQVKLLRVLQEKYIERIGSKEETRIDVRIIAATNRNLEKEVAEGRFRLDLYYRLNVFPITLPALRDRIEDIPALASHFIQHFNQKSGKKITGLSEKVLQDLSAYHWPGNIRELENLIERSVLLAKDNIIDNIAISGTQQQETMVAAKDIPMKTIHENEKDYIITVLKKCNGRIWGPGGAAEILKVPPSTLKSKMNKLGIRKEYKG